MGSRWRLTLDGHTFEVGVDAERSVVELRLDGAAPVEQPVGPLRHRFALSADEVSTPGEVIVRTWGRPAVRHASLRRTPALTASAQPTLPRRGGEAIDFEPPAGSAARRRYDWKQRHAGLYASRHVVLATARVLLGVVGISFLFRWLPTLDWPALPWPELTLPRVPWPDVDWPDLPLPSFTLPAWIRTLLDSRVYWLPIVLAVLVARREVRRRRRRQQAEAASSPPEAADRQHEGDGAHR